MENIGIKFINYDCNCQWRLKLKHLMDILGSGLGLVFTSPIIFIASLLIKLDSGGPILFRQKRVGKDGRIFTIYKFRTMKVDAERETGPVWAQDDDPRITNVGYFLRKTHVDEIPQLINIFKGDMSLVGPRPERPIFVRKLNRIVPNYDTRLTVKPGITGLAQVNHRYDKSVEDVRRKLRYDILYIKKMCPLLDVRILGMTFLIAVQGKQRLLNKGAEILNNLNN